MKKLNEYCVLYGDDDDPLGRLRKINKQIDEMVALGTKTNPVYWAVPLVAYNTETREFSLYVLSYHGDGYNLMHVRHFMTKCKTNLQVVAETYNIKPEIFFNEVNKQVTKIASEIDFPYHISVLIGGKFMGLVATIHHPIDEITNKGGINN